MLTGLIVGFVTGLLSGMGVGGGTLLLIWLTGWAGFSKTAAQGVNLLYFLPCSAAALVSHVRNKLVDRRVVLPAVLGGLLTGIPAALLATGLQVQLLRRFYGGFLLLVGLRELFSELFGKRKK